MSQKEAAAYAAKLHKFFFSTTIMKDIVNKYGSGPFFMKEIKALQTYKESRFDGLSLSGLLVAHWMIHNADNKMYVYIPPNVGPVMLFEDQLLAERFEKWFVANPLPEAMTTKIFENKDDFVKLVTEDGIISLGGKVHMPLDFYDTNTRIDEITFKLWIWLRDHISGKYWYWDKHFYFEKHEDATLFKLTWYPKSQQENIMQVA